MWHSCLEYGLFPGDQVQVNPDRVALQHLAYLRAAQVGRLFKVADHQEVDVAFQVVLPFGVGAEEQDNLWIATPDDQISDTIQHPLDLHEPLKRVHSKLVRVDGVGWAASFVSLAHPTPSHQSHNNFLVHPLGH